MRRVAAPPADDPGQLRLTISKASLLSDAASRLGARRAHGSGACKLFQDIELPPSVRPSLPPLAGGIYTGIVPAEHLDGRAGPEAPPRRSRSRSTQVATHQETNSSSYKVNIWFGQTPVHTPVQITVARAWIGADSAATIATTSGFTELPHSTAWPPSATQQAATRQYQLCERWLATDNGSDQDDGSPVQTALRRAASRQDPRHD